MTGGEQGHRAWPGLGDGAQGRPPEDEAEAQPQGIRNAGLGKARDGSGPESHESTRASPGTNGDQLCNADLQKADYKYG